MAQFLNQHFDQIWYSYFAVAFVIDKLWDVRSKLTAKQRARVEPDLIPLLAKLALAEHHV